MPDHVEPRPENDDEGLPLFWGLILVIVVALIAVWLFGRFDAEEPGTTTTMNALVEPLKLAELLSVDGRFTAMLGLLDSAALVAELEGSGPVTLFAPTDEALDGVEPRRWSAN